MKRLFLLSTLLHALLACGQDKKLCITVDDLPAVTYGAANPGLEAEITKKLIAAFQKYRIPAIGFVVGQSVYNNGRPDTARLGLLELWLNSGCDLGNHSFSHPDFNRVDHQAYFEDLLKGQGVIEPLLQAHGKTARYFRHPYLHAGPDPVSGRKLQSFLDAQGYTVSPVTIDNDDYVYARAYHRALANHDPALARTIAEAYLDHMEKALLHFERKSMEVYGRHIAQTLLLHASLLNADYLDALARLYQKHGYTFVSQEEALKDPAYATEIRTYSTRGLSWIYRWGMSLGRGEDLMAGETSVPEQIRRYAGE
jgi:peptidoglycan/xylan/chitin deacetylase (PgdA/CDA1 family)